MQRFTTESNNVSIGKWSDPKDNSQIKDHETRGSVHKRSVQQVAVYLREQEKKEVKKYQPKCKQKDKEAKEKNPETLTIMHKNQSRSRESWNAQNDQAGK